MPHKRGKKVQEALLHKLETLCKAPEYKIYGVPPVFSRSVSPVITKDQIDKVRSMMEGDPVSTSKLKRTRTSDR